MKEKLKGTEQVILELFVFFFKNLTFLSGRFGNSAVTSSSIGALVCAVHSWMENCREDVGCSLPRVLAVRVRRVLESKRSCRGNKEELKFLCRSCRLHLDVTLGLSCC